MYNECRHVMPSGRKCHSPALSGKPYCYYHQRLHQFHASAAGPATQLPVPQIEDARGIQLALAQALHALNSPYFEPRRLGLLFYGLQIATQLLKHASPPEPAETIRDLSDASGAPVDLDAPAASEPGAEILAPVKEVCEPPSDCRNCPRHNTCDNYEEPEEDEEEEDEDGEGEDDSEEEDDEDSEEGEDDSEEDDEDGSEEYLDEDEINRRFFQALQRRRTERNARNHPHEPSAACPATLT